LNSELQSCCNKNLCAQPSGRVLCPAARPLTPAASFALCQYHCLFWPLGGGALLWPEEPGQGAPMLLWARPGGGQGGGGHRAHSSPGSSHLAMAPCLPKNYDCFNGFAPLAINHQRNCSPTKHGDLICLREECGLTPNARTQETLIESCQMVLPGLGRK